MKKSSSVRRSELELAYCERVAEIAGRRFDVVGALKAKGDTTQDALDDAEVIMLKANLERDLAKIDLEEAKQ